MSASGTAGITDASLNPGSYKIDAVYIPTGTFTASRSGNQIQTITAASTKVLVKSSANPAIKNKAVSFSVTVANESAGSSAVPLGTVVFKIDGKTMQSLKLSGGEAVLSGIKLPVGTHTVTILYTPLNHDFAGGSGALSGGETINK